jgi:hypothetical protein
MRKIDWGRPEQWLKAERSQACTSYGEVRSPRRGKSYVRVFVFVCACVRACVHMCVCVLVGFIVERRP